ncbi:hypothetical protein [Pseudobacter ginsenosidimutans]|jgi:hypothetical protein|uniref:Uncharacterized protein n=1 Tax=Pseudobacter ginsenosidimutans TaxID=661488 RepID=A0A4Q7MS20_9BACT|nr:hypothetical protein [Pseudobacter ginsenosidimutans]RZS70704.1 hypothetical protein EV199_2597 [Pseudobacter ginsenosidimutans]
MITLLRILLFIALTTLNVEYLINRQSSTLLLVLAIVIQLALIYFLITPLIKKLIRK